MTKHKFNFDEDSKVDPNRLHEECFNYGRQAWKYGEALSDAIEEKQRIHEKLKVRRSELILKARSDPKKCGLNEKPTNDQIESYYRTDKQHKELKEKFIQAEHTVNILQAGVNSIQFSKSTGLDLAVQLWKGDYYSVEGLPQEVPIEWEAWKVQKTETASEKQRTKMRRTTNVKK